MPNPAQAELYPGLLPVEPVVEPPPIHPTTLEDNESQSQKPSLRKRASRAITRFLTTFCIGVAATLAWQSYGDAAREIIANSYPHLRWLAPQTELNRRDTIELVAPVAVSVDQQQLSLDLEAVRQSVDRIAAGIAIIEGQISRSADRIATEQIAHNVAQLAAAQEQMTGEITKLQAVEQYVLYNAEPPQGSTPAPTRSPSQRSTLDLGRRLQAARARQRGPLILAAPAPWYMR
jgi:hypothetical protein